MSGTFGLSILLLLVSAGLSLHLCFFLFARARDSKSARILAGMMAATAAWALLYALEFLTPGLEGKVALGSLQYLPISSIPVLQFLFGTRLKLGDDRSKPRFLSLSTLLWIEPLLTCALVWTDPSLGLVRRDIRLDQSFGFPTVLREFGPWFWFHAAYDYVLIVIGTARVILALGRRSEGGRMQAGLLSIAALVPLLANLAYIAKLWPLPALDPTPVAFAVTGAAYLLVFSRFRFLALLPVAQDAALAGLQEGVFIVDQDGRVAFMNEAAVGFLGLSRVESGLLLTDLAGRNPAVAQLPDRVGGSGTMVVGEGAGARHLEARCEAVMKGRTRLALVWSLHDITARVEAEEGLRSLNRELEARISEGTAELRQMNDRLESELERRRETERQLFFFSLHDPLTGLPNRSLLLSRLGQAIERLRRDPEPPFALLYIDFDNFKLVNDSFGHAAGDSFLREATARLTKAVRGVDTVARLGGDEFVVLLDKVNNREEALEVGDRIAGELAMPIRLGDNRLVPAASVGILVATPEHASPEELLRDADMAMYRAKSEGKNRRMVFDAGMRTAIIERTRLTRDLNDAILESGITLAYQPIVRLADGAIVGCEALARWKHPELGDIGPDRFIPVAEETDLIVPLGLFVLMEACRTAVLMRETTGREDLFIAVNVSAIQLGQADFPAILVSAIERHGLGPESIHLEITESALVERTETILPVLHELRGRGFRFKLDDFGTGYSSLAYLHRFPIDTIKIDRSFVSDLVDAEAAPGGAGEGIVRGIISLGHELGKTIVAEGIETGAQARVLAAWGCDSGQGWLYGRPVAREAWLGLLAEELAGARASRA